MSAEEFKAKGNAAFQAGKNDEAINWFTSAIELDPGNHILYSNRSAAYCASEQYSKAFDDAVKVNELKPDWAKGWSRKGAALHGKKDFAGAVEAYNKGLSLEPGNETCKKGVEDAKAAMGGGGGGANPFSKIFGPDVWVKIKTNPKLAPFLDEPDYVNMIKAMQTNPQAINMFLQDKRIMQTFACLCGIDMASADDFMGEEEGRPQPSKPAPKPEPKPAPSTSSSSSLSPKAQEAEAEKEKGNAFYKSKEFDKAIECYDRALELCPENIVYLINKAAVFLEQQNFDECVKICDEAVEKGRSSRADVKTIAKALARKGSALHKLKKFDDAIAAFKSSLMEHRVADTLNKLNACEKDKKDTEAAAYLDDGKAAEAKERGNEKFKAGDFPGAVREYDEAIKRKPNDPTYYCNRAAAYTKLNELQHAMTDCDRALELDPKYVKAISRKAGIYFWRKEYHKALEWYEKGLAEDPSNEELRKGLECTLQQVNSAQQSSDVDEDRLRKAMADPEIQSILHDPILQSVLRDFKENPKAAQQHLKSPEIMEKIQKLIAAGVLRTSSQAM
eukprot:RCo048974